METLQVTCPCCAAVLSVEASTGRVTAHGPAGEKPPKADMERALKDLRESGGRREEVFRRSMADEKNKSEILQKKFEDAVRRARENPDALPPREIDL